MLSNAYFLAKFRFDTAENEPPKILLIFRETRSPTPPLSAPEGPAALLPALRLVDDVVARVEGSSVAGPPPR